MLRLRDAKSDRVMNFYVMDSHHHLGEDEDGREVKPTGVNNSYSFCKKVINGDSETDGIRNELENHPENYRWTIPEDGLIRPHPLIEEFDPKEIKRKELETHSIDQIVVFPMQDVFRDKGDIMYQTSNNFIERWTKIPPHSRRLVGFGRIDPNEPLGENMEEINRMVNECGLKGLKLHPQSEDFDVGDLEVKKILKKAAYQNIPVIFHTSFGVEVKKLHDVCNEIIAEFYEKGLKSKIKQLKIIIGHCTYQSEKVFTALSHPCIYGELSTLGNPKDYFDILSDNVEPRRYFEKSFPHLNEINDKIEKEDIKDIFGLSVTSFEWHNKVMMGTDNPYMPVVKLVDLLKALFSKDADLDGRCIQNILSANLLRLLPPRLESGQTCSHKEGFNFLFREDIKLLEINPFVEPIIGGGVDTHTNFVRVMNKNGFEKHDEERTIDLFHKKIELCPISEGKEKIEENELYSLEEMKEKYPYIFNKSNPRELPNDPQERASLSSIASVLSSPNFGE